MKMFPQAIFRKICLAAGMALLGVTVSSQAALFVYEPFDYNPIGANLAGQNGGTGFSTAWTGGGYTTIAGLTYPGMPTSGNAVTGGGQTSRDFAAPVTALSGSVYVSFLLDQVSANFGNVTLFNTALPESELFSFGDTYTGSTYSPTYSMYISSGADNAGYLSSGVGITTGTQLLVVELDYSVSGQTGLYFYLNPTVGTLAPDHSSAIISHNVATAALAFNRIRLEDAGDGWMDEIRVANTYPEVVGVPEPGTVGMLALASSIGLFFVRRRFGARGSAS